MISKYLSEELFSLLLNDEKIVLDFLPIKIQSKINNQIALRNKNKEATINFQNSGKLDYFDNNSTFEYSTQESNIGKVNSITNIETKNKYSLLVKTKNLYFKFSNRYKFQLQVFAIIFLVIFLFLLSYFLFLFFNQQIHKKDFPQMFLEILKINILNFFKS